MKQSQRVRIFAGGFFAGCILAAGIALLRNASEPDRDLGPLTVFERATPVPPLPDLPFEYEKAFSAWQSPESDEIRWLVPDLSGRLWRVSLQGETVTIWRANELRVDGNPGIEPPALRAGLEHNHFEILTFDPLETIFTVKIDPFEPNSIEENIRLLLSREPYIIDAGPILFGEENTPGSRPN